MRILLVVTKGSWGGATRYVFDLAKALHNKNIDVAVAFGGEGALLSKLETEKIPYFQIKNLGRDVNFGKEFHAYKELYGVIASYNPDIVHVNSSKGGLAALAAKRQQKKTIFTVHGWAFNERRNFLSKIVIKLIYQITILLSDKVILVSEALHRQIRNWPFQHKMKVIHNGIMTQDPLSRKDARNFLSRIDPSLENVIEDDWLITIAELHDSKGLDIGIASLAELRGTRKKLPHYILIGSGEEQWRLQKLVDSYNVSDFVHFLGHVENAQKYIPAGDLFILPSRTEALGYVLLEAGLAKVPVIATRVGGIPEIIESGRNGILIPASSGKVLATAISNVLDDKKNRKVYPEKLYEDVISKFSLEKMVEDTCDVYTIVSRK